MTVMMIVIVEVVEEVMVIIDIVDNQYTARRVHGGEGGGWARRISYCIFQFCKFICSFSNFPPSLPTDPQTVDGKVPAIPHYVLNCATTNLVGGWKQAILPASGWGQGQGLQDSPGAGCRVAACACDHDGDNIG